MMKQLVILFLAAVNIFAQQKNPDDILENVKNNFNRVNNYITDVTIKLDMDFLQVPESKAKLHFKQPDKTKFDSESFAMMPKQVLNITPSKLLAFDYTAIYIRSEKLNETDVDVIKIIPNSDSTNMLLSTLWIDSKMSLVRKVETTTKNSGTIVTELNYNSNLDYPLPSEIKVMFKIAEANLPANPDQSIVNHNQSGRRRKLEGSVTLTYTNYVVNKGISDHIFIETDNKIKLDQK